MTPSVTGASPIDDLQMPVQHPAQRPPVKVDGRNMRRDRNKDAVIDAFLDLVFAGTPRPSVADVAERSGVSHRSVFRYFADTDELARASIARQIQRVAPMLDTSVDLTLSFADRAETVIDRRLSLFAAIAPVARLIRVLAVEQPIAQAELASIRLLYREQLRRMFAPELAVMDAERAANTTAIIDVLCSFDAVDLLLTDQGLSRDEAEAALRHALFALFAYDGRRDDD